MKTTKCDRCGAESTDQNNDIFFVDLTFEIRYDLAGFSGTYLKYDICGKCRNELEIDSLCDLITKFIKEMPEEKG